jgi:uncharacterized RDD family membrane protein YckC
VSVKPQLDFIGLRLAVYPRVIIAAVPPLELSAAQNGPVTRICPKCGALLLTRTANCSFCGIPGELAASSPRIATSASSSKSTGEIHWQSEVTRRLGDYRARKQRLQPEAAQPVLPFRQPKESPEPVRERPRPRANPNPSHRRMERLEICVQPELDFSSSADDRARPQTALVPVASLSRRRGAAALDALFIGITSAGFLALFHALGGQIGFEKMDILVYAVVLYLFYGQYFFLFTTLAGATPGMQLCELSCVRLDGSLPDTRQLLWRGFGYLLSGATLLIGFLWAIWDEDHFTWQDRISQTYVTAASPVEDTPPTEIRARRVQMHI